MTMQQQPDLLCRLSAGPLAEAPAAAVARPASVAASLATPYRADIDGLRAVAVVGVVLFHARIPGFSGGYVGVDVFFVISGYLITQLLVGSSSRPASERLRTFYLRRARRILPALLMVSVITTAVASVLLLPYSLMVFGKFLTASSVFLGNLAAWQEGNYFNSESYLPLGHFWSLAVEEQFYLVYPLFLLLLTGYPPHRRLLGMIALAMASFALCVWASHHKSASNFYLAPTRAWELLLGAIVALGAQHWSPARLTREILALLSGVALLWAILSYDDQLAYPGWATLVPCGATAILIATNREGATYIGKFLSLPPLVFTGLISYSLYLWHVPVQTFVKYCSLEAVGQVGIAITLGATYAIATLSWKTIEVPIRTRSLLTGDRTFLWTAGAINTALLATGLAFWFSSGLPQRFNVADAPLAWIGDRNECDSPPDEKVASGTLCSAGPQTATAPRALVWGDSHTLALIPAYRHLADAHGIRVYYASRASCRPLLGATNKLDPLKHRLGCENFNNAVVNAVARLNPRVVILNAHWIDQDEDLLLDGAVVPPAGTSNFRFALEQTIQHISAPGRSICVVLDVPTFKYDVGRALLIARWRGLSDDLLQVSRTQALQQFAGPERDIRMLAQEHLLTAVDLKDTLCKPSGGCAFRANGYLLYADADHLSSYGALFVAPTLDRCFQE